MYGNFLSFPITSDISYGIAAPNVWMPDLAIDPEAKSIEASSHNPSQLSGTCGKQNTGDANQ